MALPRLNDVPEYSIKIPSTKKSVKFRPFLVKEQKILLLALESRNTEEILRAIMNTINACSNDEIRAEELSTFDVDYLFIAIRAKSVGEKVRPNLRCLSCNEMSEVTIKLDDLKIDVKKQETTIDINDSIKIQMKYPSYNDILNKGGITDETTAMDLIHLSAMSSINAVLTEDERIIFSEETLEEQKRFIESLNIDQFQKITEYVSSIPSLRHELNWNCEKCGEENYNILQGYEDFF